MAADLAIADVRRRSHTGKLTTPARWIKLAFHPIGVDGNMFARDLVSYIEQRPHAEDSPTMGSVEVPLGYDDRPELDDLDLDDPLPEPEVTDIVLLYGSSNVYLYSKPLLSHSFAHVLFNAAEGDDLATFADAVRNESRVYPRPMAAASFLNHPYLWSGDKVADVYEQVRQKGAFSDIERTVTSLGESYYYSTRYLSAAQGRALAEWHGVERIRNP